MKLSFVTVTFWEDFDLLEQQLSSMDQYVNHGYVHFVVLNDSDTHLPELEKIIQSHNCYRYKIITRSQLQDRYPTLLQKSQLYNGWHMQQVLKLVIANEVKTEFYCLLDSKDFFVATSNRVHPIQKFFIDNKPIGVIDVNGVSKEFDTYRKNSYQLFGLPDLDEYCLRSHTPFIMKTSYVLDMIDNPATRNKSLIQIIEGTTQSDRCVEFYLYSAWLNLNQIINQYHLVNTLDQFGTSFDVHKTKRRKTVC